jgi:hypothetical protein
MGFYQFFPFFGVRLASDSSFLLLTSRLASLKLNNFSFYIPASPLVVIHLLVIKNKYLMARRYESEDKKKSDKNEVRKPIQTLETTSLFLSQSFMLMRG